jgi:hypothetical protein
MAPEVALDKIEELTKPGGTVLDPMCGSGTVVRLAAEQGRIGIGVDLDPLAVTITRTACHPSWASDLVERAEAVLRRASRFGGKLPWWIARDRETRDFVEYWFAATETQDLSRIARVLIDAPRRDDPLRVAFSRMIVTKEPLVSLARDTSHSRPHKVDRANESDVFEEFTKSARRLHALIESGNVDHQPKISGVIRPSREGCAIRIAVTCVRSHVAVRTQTHGRPDGASCVDTPTMRGLSQSSFRRSRRQRVRGLHCQCSPTVNKCGESNSQST